MPKFRAPPTPERQAWVAMGRVVNLQALRRRGAKAASIGTVRNYREALTAVAKYMEPTGLVLRDFDPALAEAYLLERADEGVIGQKTLDLHRQALQVMLVHYCGRPPQPDGRLPVVKASKAQELTGRAYTPPQIVRIAGGQKHHNALATRLSHAAGLRAQELHTLRRPDEQPPDLRRATRDDKFFGRPGADYTVDGKGGLVRLVRIPHDLAAEVEALRRDEPVVVVDRGIRYLSRYAIGGGKAWSSSFSTAAKRALGWSAGAHGCRHSYAQERMDELLPHFLYEDALEIVSQEMGHFRPDITEVYLR